MLDVCSRRRLGRKAASLPSFSMSVFCLPLGVMNSSVSRPLLGSLHHAVVGGCRVAILSGLLWTQAVNKLHMKV